MHKYVQYYYYYYYYTIATVTCSCMAGNSTVIIMDLRYLVESIADVQDHYTYHVYAVLKFSSSLRHQRIHQSRKLVIRKRVVVVKNTTLSRHRTGIERLSTF